MTILFLRSKFLRRAFHSHAIADGNIADYLGPMIDISKDWTASDIQQLLETHGLNQRSLARLMHIEPRTVNRWVKGHITPSRITSVALTYLALDLAGKLKLRK